MSKRGNMVLVGRKPTMDYVLSVIMLFSAGVEEVVLKARGQSISTAVDVAEIVRRRFMKTVKVKWIGIGTDIVSLREGGHRPVSKIEITLTT